MAYVDEIELDAFILEVCHGFFDCFTRPFKGHSVFDGARVRDVSFESLLNPPRPFTEVEMQQVMQLMADSYTVKYYETIYLTDEFLDVLKKARALKQQYKQLTEKQIKESYKAILSQYAMMNVNITLSQKIKTRIRGVCGAHRRYSNLLYKKHEVIFELMLNKAKSQGKLPYLNIAVESMLPELEVALKHFDRVWIEEQLIKTRDELTSLQQIFDNYKANPPSFKSGVILTKTRHQTYLTEIAGLKVKCRDFEAALKEEPSLVLKKLLPFNTVYQPEVIKNMLRKKPEILRDILESS